VAPTDGGALLAFVVLVGWAASVVWVLYDARSMIRTGHRVTASIGSWDIEEPETWALASLVLWVLFFPMYLTARRQSHS
jgi:hypothetical protein